MCGIQLRYASDRDINEQGEDEHRGVYLEMQARDGLHHYRDVVGSEEAACHVPDTHRGAERLVIGGSRVRSHQEGLRCDGVT